MVFGRGWLNNLDRVFPNGHLPSVEYTAMFNEEAREKRKLRRVEKGLINSTWKYSNEYLFQELNTDIFKNPATVNRNYRRLEKHLEGKKSKVRIPRMLKKWKFMRSFEYIPSKTFLKPKDEHMAFKTAFAFGKFQEAFLDMPLDRIKETIPNFHNIESRFSQLEDSTKKNKFKRVECVQKEIYQVLQERTLWEIVAQQMENCEKRIVHYDTKISNVLFDKNNKVKAIIDLDTTMPGFTFFDYGDMIRSMCSKSKEDARQLGRVKIQKTMFEAITEGYLAATSEWLTLNEKSYLLYGAMYITLENAVRFLTDYINGDVYFRTSEKDQNLHRFKTQYKLYEELKKDSKKYQKIIYSI